MSNSSLVSYTMISPNNGGKRTLPISRISIHCVGGQCTAEALGLWFYSPLRRASANYGVGLDGKIGMYVGEDYMAWTSSNHDNDMRAVTIETACDPTHPYRVNGAAYAALVNLCTDICRRNDKTKLLWLGDKAKTLAYRPTANEMVLTVHRWFAAKACPGDYLLNLHAQIAAEVTRRLSVGAAAAPSPKVSENGSYIVQITASVLNVRAEASSSGRIRTTVKRGEYYTIVAESNGWGKLKSGAGWIFLAYTKKIA